MGPMDGCWNSRRLGEWDRTRSSRTFYKVYNGDSIPDSSYFIMTSFKENPGDTRSSYDHSFKAVIYKFVEAVLLKNTRYRCAKCPESWVPLRPKVTETRFCRQERKNPGCNL